MSEETIRACGCVPFMRSRDREVLALLILRPGGYWEFPKGKQEEGESDTETALRELQEETGLVGEIQEESPIDITYSFERNSVRYQKDTRYFFCRVPDASPVTLQKGEANDFVWLPLEDLADRATYPQMKEVARKAYQMLAD